MKVGIIGGGAAGMMAALTIKELRPEIEVTLIEKNPTLGKKVAISGGGRCNVTTGLTDVKKILNCYPRGSKFLSYAMYEFGPEKVMQWFDEKGLKLKTEADLRVFPVSNNGAEVVEVLTEKFASAGGKILTGKQVIDVKQQDGNFVVSINDNPDLIFDKIVLCVGGQAYRQTGSTGDGYSWAEKLGHSITKLGPSLNAFVLAEQWVAQLAGVSFKEADFSVGKTYHSTGPFLFTHKGITGPAVFALSSMIAWDWDNKTPLPIKIDFFPADFPKGKIKEPLPKNQEQLLQFFQEQIIKNPKKSFKNILHILLPKSVSACLLQAVGVNGEKHNAEVSKKELQAVVESVKGLQLNIVGATAGEEFVTAGGVNTDEVDAKTMESKLCPNLYFGGEILNVDGFTGGFNLQAAWATGRVAGLAIAA